MARKLNPKIRHHLTAEEKERLRALASEGMSASEISRQMKLTRNTAAAWKKRFGFPTKPPLPDTKILSLLGTMDQRSIAKLVGIPHRRIKALAIAHGFGRKPSRELSINELVALISDIRNRRGSAASLARRYNYSYTTTLKLCHAVLECEKFLPTWRTPLSSYFGSRSQPSLQNPVNTLALNLVSAIGMRFPDGVMPADADSVDFAGRITDTFLPEIMPKDVRGVRSSSEWLQVRANFAAQIRAAVATLHLSHTALVN